MTRLVWNELGKRFYEAGVDRGVLYVSGKPGVPWNGLTGVSESPSGGEAKAYYIDGVKYMNVSSAEEYEATLTAFTYPDEFAECDGSVQPRAGLYFHHQRRKSFGFTYRTKIGNDLSGDFAYKIHIVYNALASPTERPNATISSDINPNDFSWGITARPPAMLGYNPTPHITVDSRNTDPSVLQQIEDILYGTESESPRLPDVTELVAIYDTTSELTVVDNGDGTWTATAPYDVIRMIDDSTFSITSPAAVFTDEDTYTLSSE